KYVSPAGGKVVLIICVGHVAPVVGGRTVSDVRIEVVRIASGGVLIRYAVIERLGIGVVATHCKAARQPLGERKNPGVVIRLPVVGLDGHDLRLIAIVG